MLTTLLKYINFSDFYMKYPKGINGMMKILKGVAADINAP